MMHLTPITLTKPSVIFPSLGIIENIGPQPKVSRQEDSQRQIYDRIMAIKREFYKAEIVDIEQLKQFYDGTNDGEVISFIRKNSFLLPILIDAQEHIGMIFGLTIQKYLEVHFDPEDNYTELFIVIKSPYDPIKARQLMDKLDDEWFIPIMKDTQGKLCITEEPL